MADFCIFMVDKIFKKLYQMRSDIISKRSNFDFSPFSANTVNLFTEAKNFLRLAFFNSLYRLVFKKPVVYEKWNLTRKMTRGSSLPRDWTDVSSIAGWFFTIWATRESLNISEYHNTKEAACLRDKTGPFFFLDRKR